MDLTPAHLASPQKKQNSIAWVQLSIKYKENCSKVMYSPPIYLLESGTQSWQFPSPPDTPPPEVEELPSSVRASCVNVPQTYLWVLSLSSFFPTLDMLPAQAPCSRLYRRLAPLQMVSTHSKLYRLWHPHMSQGHYFDFFCWNELFQLHVRNSSM